MGSHHSRVRGECFWEWKFRKFWPHIGFSSKLFFQNSSCQTLQTREIQLSTTLHNGMLHSPIPRSSFFRKFFSPVRCPIWGENSESEKSKKSDPQSHFTPKQDFQKSSFCSNSQVGWGDCSHCSVWQPLQCMTNTLQYYKLMISEKKVRMEIDFGVPIFENFHFQKHAPIWDMCRVKKISNFENSNLLLPKGLYRQRPWLSCHDNPLYSVNFSPKITFCRIESVPAVCNIYYTFYAGNVLT